MKISTALALGRTILKPIARVKRRGDYGCALGMIDAATSPMVRHEMYFYMERHAVPHPCTCGSSLATITSVIIHLFDCHVMEAKDWTMDQLIDWLATVEPADPEEAVVTERVQKEMEVEVCP